MAAAVSWRSTETILHSPGLAWVCVFVLITPPLRAVVAKPKDEQGGTVPTTGRNNREDWARFAGEPQKCEGLPPGGSPSIIEPGLASDFNVLHQAAAAALSSQNLDRNDDPGRGSRPRRETM